ncbi:MAG TPA: cytochrome c biogenesis protein CcsA, partial [Anaerolineales bacterium]|nr:cytochrome c biogenesis protein CcsA [Anaerolineales bacterium]
MTEEIGYTALVMAFLLALYGAAAAAFGAKRQRPELVESARRAMVLSWPLISVAALAIIALLVSGRYDVEYVAKVTSSTMPPYLKVTALWGGQAGSLVFWSWLMAAFASAVGLRRWDRDRDLLPWVIVVTMVTLAFFLSLVIFVENPFRRLWLDPVGNTVTAFLRPAGARPLVPADGQGLNPLLRHPGMIIHPPMLYLGFVSFVIPYAFAIAALVTRRTDDRWIRVTRRWTLVAWLFLSLVIFVENPFRRLWLDPVGNTVTAFLRPAGARPLVPADGQGLNPLLRHPGMIIHPPMLYLGFVSFVIPFAFAIAALVTRRTDDRWIRVTRRWTLVAWLFLALGLILGGRWAYDVLGWGGYWGWDPVEIAAFMPFLSGTAFLHSVMVQEKKGMLKHWNVLLIILT